MSGRAGYAYAAKSKKNYKFYSDDESAHNYQIISGHFRKEKQVANQGRPRSGSTATIKLRKTMKKFQKFLT